jgi:hypothetical protein
MAGSVSAIWKYMSMTGLIFAGTLAAAPRACDQRITVLSSEPINQSQPRRFVEVLVVDENEEPVANIEIALKQKIGAAFIEIDSGLTDTEVGRIYLKIKDVSEFNTGQIVLKPPPGSANTDVQTYNITYYPEQYSKQYKFKLGEMGAFSEMKAAAQNPTLVPPSSAAKPPESTPTATPPPRLFLDEFTDNRHGWETGIVQAPFSDYISGQVFIKNGFLNFNYVIHKSYWTHNLDVPTSWYLDDFVYEADFIAQTLPQSGVSRFHTQFRVMPDGSHYSVVIDCEGIVTVYYTNPGGEANVIENYVSADYKPLSGELNRLMLTVRDNTFDIRINGGETRQVIDESRSITQPGGWRLAVDGPAPDIESYKLDRIIIREWDEAK